jgi:hypothetical protein
MALLDKLAHSIKWRYLLESKLLKPIRVYKKHTAAASFDQELQRIAHQDAATYAYQHFRSAMYFQTKKDLYHYMLPQLQAVEGLLIECGVYKAATINYFAAHTSNRQWHGFDSFEGLPDAWGGNEKRAGAFSLQGKLPAVKHNVDLHKGWFDQTLPPFLQSAKEQIAFVHLDADIYASTLSVLSSVTPYLKTGSLLLFDEYFGQVGWREGEHKALADWLGKHPDITTKCLALSSSGAVLMQITIK